MCTNNTHQKSIIHKSKILSDGKLPTDISFNLEAARAWYLVLRRSDVDSPEGEKWLLIQLKLWCSVWPIGLKPLWAITLRNHTSVKFSARKIHLKLETIYEETLLNKSSLSSCSPLSLFDEIKHNRSHVHFVPVRQAFSHLIFFPLTIISSLVSLAEKTSTRKYGKSMGIEVMYSPFHWAWLWMEDLYKSRCDRGMQAICFFYLSLVCTFFNDIPNI